MKYLKLFEGFEGSIIPSVIGFLNKKGVTTGSLFFERLKGICDEFDISLSRITNDNLKYLPSYKAIKIKPEFKSNNFNNINCIKFWFSMDKYLGYTGVGYSDYLKEFENSMNSYIRTIKNSLGIETGIIEKISSYSELNTGDDIILNIDGRISNAKFYNYRNTYYYAIQNYYEGSEPTTLDWQKYGRYSWELSRVNDHNLFKYIKSEDPLHLKQTDASFNLPIRLYRLTTWDSSYNSIPSYKEVSESSFCIILYLDGLENISRSLISKNRSDSKRNSLSLMSYADIKSDNIQRYYGKILSNMASNSDEDLNNSKNINRLILSYIRSKYSIFSIINDDPSISRMRSLANNIRDIVISKGSESSIRSATSGLTHLISLCDGIEKGYIESINMISMENNLASHLTNSIIEVLLSIGDLIHEYCRKVNLDNLYDYTSVYLKINSLRGAFTHDQYKLSLELSRIIENLYYTNDVNSLINNTRIVSELVSNHNKDLYKAKALYKHAKSIFILN